MRSFGERVTLRAEHNGADSRYLWAYLEDRGNLHIDGQDLGPSTSTVSSGGEYQSFKTIRAEHLPRFLREIGIPASGDAIEILMSRFSGASSYEVEQRLRESPCPTESTFGRIRYPPSNSP